MSIRNPMRGSAQEGAARDVWSVSGINNAIRDQLQNDPQFRNVWIEGELLNVTYHSSGHIYFSLKDPDSMIRATFFRNANASYRHIKLVNGMQVLIQGSISVYAKNGAYQLNVVKVMLAGEGELRQRIEQLKQKLYSEGLFAAERKKSLPYFPITLGVATAATGAAIQDIIRVARSRNPLINILLAPCKVQGEGADLSIAGAIRALNQADLKVDVIIAGRGGGSFEDLLPFSEELAVRAFVESRVPIVSAVGHEIDNSISDLVADQTAATPSAAAELVVPRYDEFDEFISECEARMLVALRNRYLNESNRLKSLLAARVFSTPISLLEGRSQMLDMYEDRMRAAQENLVARSRVDYENTQQFLPIQYKRLIESFSRRYELTSERLQNFSPLATLGRGYAVVRDMDKEVIRSSSSVNTGQELEVLLADGNLIVKVAQQE